MDPNQQNTPQQPYQVPQLPVKKSKKMMIIAGGIIGVLILVIGVLSLVVVSRNSNKLGNNQSSQTSDPLLATVGNQKIYKSTVEKAASEQYDPNSLTNKVIKEYLQIVVERAILGIEADKQGITVTDTDIADYKLKYPAIRNQNTIRFNIIKEKLIAKDVNYVDAYTVGYAIPPLGDGYIQTPENIERRALENTVGDELVQRINGGEEPIVVAQSIYDQYPILQPVLGVNGYILQTSTDTKELEDPRRFVYDPRNKGFPLYEALFNQTPGPAKKYIWEDGSGLSVIQVISAHKSSVETYKQWIDTKKKELVVYNQDELGKL